MTRFDRYAPFTDTVNFCREDSTGKEIEFEIITNIRPVRPGNRSGWPEDWTPDEPGEVELLSVNCEALGIKNGNPGEVFNEQEIKDIETKAWENQDPPDPDYDDRDYEDIYVDR